MTKAHHEAPQPVATDTITIQGIEFTYTTPYVPGTHVLTEGEANALNQVKGENERNNFAAKVKAAKAKAEEERGEGAELSEEEVEELKAAFAEYDAGYVFSGLRQRRAPVDPVAKRAAKIARELIESALRSKGYKPSDLPEGKMDELIEQYIEAHPEVVEEAKAQIERTKALASGALEGLSLPEKAAQAA